MEAQLENVALKLMSEHSLQVFFFFYVDEHKFKYNKTVIYYAFFLNYIDDLWQRMCFIL